MTNNKLPVHEVPSPIFPEKLTTSYDHQKISDPTIVDYISKISVNLVNLFLSSAGPAEDPLNMLNDNDDVTFFIMIITIMCKLITISLSF